MLPQRTYIYGIVRESQPRQFELLGIENAPVYSINHEQLAAVVSHIDLPDVDPTRANLLAHTIVQDALIREYVLLPMGFGMIADGGDDEVKGLLGGNYDGLLSELARLDGKIEVEVKVFWDREAMIRQLQGGGQELARVKASIDAIESPTARQNLLIEAGQRVERIVMEWRSKYAREVFATLKRASVDARLCDPVGVQNIMNASFLIDRSKTGEFQGQVHDLNSRFQEKVNFKCVGPLPPYSFVNLRLRPAEC